MFYVNLPVGAAAIAVLYFAFPPLRTQHHKHGLDILGVFSLIGWVVPLLLALTFAPMQGITSPSVLLQLGLSLAFLLVFLIAETRSAEPIVPLSLFSNPVIAVSCLSLLFVALGMFGAILFVPLYFQAVLGASASMSGYLMIPMMLMITIGSVISGQLISRIGKYKIIALVGVATVAVGYFLLSTMTSETTLPVAIMNLLVVGTGLGFLMPIYTLAGQNAVPQKMIGVATGVTQFFRSIGGTLGAAIFNSVLLLRYSSYLNAHMPKDTTAELRELLANPLKLSGAAGSFSNIQGGSVEVISTVKHALVYALDMIFLVAGCVMVVCFVLNFFLKELELRRHPENVNAAPADPEIVTNA